jgi:hypothetical protein
MLVSGGGRNSASGNRRIEVQLKLPFRQGMPAFMAVPMFLDKWRISILVLC